MASLGVWQGMLQGLVVQGTLGILGVHSRQKHTKGFLAGPSAKRTAEFLKLSRIQTRKMTCLLTMQCHLKGHPFKLGIADNPVCTG